MAYLPLDGIGECEIVAGFHARFVHTANVTVAHWRVDAGSVLPVHAHVHEQISHVLEGRFEMNVDGDTRVLDAGVVAVIGPNVPHGGKALTDCRIIDVFHPARNDYR